MEEKEISASEAADRFNDISTVVQSKIDSLAKQILLVSGGVQTITIGAFLGGAAPALLEPSIALLRRGWCLLSISIIACLTLMLLQIFGSMHVRDQLAEKLKQGTADPEIKRTWPALRIIDWLIGLSAFGSCVLGVIFISRAAMSIIGVGHPT